MSAALRLFIRAVFGNLRRRARNYGITGGQCGAVTIIQRFGSALNLTPHFHVLAIDGVYAAASEELPRFYALRTPEHSDVLEVAGRMARDLTALLDRDGRTDDQDNPEIAELYSAAITGRSLSERDSGKRDRKSTRLNSSHT